MPARGRKAHTSWHNQVGYCFVSNNDIEIFSEGQGWWWWACLEGEPPTSPARHHGLDRSHVSLPGSPKPVC